MGIEARTEGPREKRVGWRRRAVRRLGRSRCWASCSPGGYGPTYGGYTGEPIDREWAHVTGEGFFEDGYVLDLCADRTTGMVSFEVFQRRWGWRELSERALVVHRPAEACEGEGFRPDFSDP